MEPLDGTVLIYDFATNDWVSPDGTYTIHDENMPRSQA